MASSRPTLFLVFSVALSTLWLIGCQSSQKELVGGYKLVRMNGCEHRIWHPPGSKPEDRLTSGNVQRYAVFEKYIAGYEDNECLPPETRPISGYFAIDTGSGMIAEGLTETEWRALLSTWQWRDPKLNSLK